MHRIRTPVRFRADTSSSHSRRNGAFCLGAASLPVPAGAAKRLHIHHAMANEDSVWKEVLDTYFREFLEFFFPEIHRDIDWSGPVEFFDKELEPLLADSEIGKRLADKLAKVFLLDGGEEWLLIHVEVQGTRESDFPERMFVYNVKIFLHF